MLGNEAAEAGLWSIRSAWRRAVCEALAQRYGQTPGGKITERVWHWSQALKNEGLGVRKWRCPWIRERVRVEVCSRNGNSRSTKFKVGLCASSSQWPRSTFRMGNCGLRAWSSECLRRPCWGVWILFWELVTFNFFLNGEILFIDWPFKCRTLKLAGIKCGIIWWKWGASGPTLAPLQERPWRAPREPWALRNMVGRPCGRGQGLRTCFPGAECLSVMEVSDLDQFQISGARARGGNLSETYTGSFHTGRSSRSKTLLLDSHYWNGGAHSYSGSLMLGTWPPSRRGLLVLDREVVAVPLSLSPS